MPVSLILHLTTGYEAGGSAQSARHQSPLLEHDDGPRTT